MKIPVKIQYEFWILVLLDFIFGKLSSDLSVNLYAPLTVNSPGVQNLDKNKTVNGIVTPEHVP